MGRRRHQRTVKIHGADGMGQPFSQSASVIDVSESGVRLQGVHVLYRAGLTVVLEYNGYKAQYRVVWVGKAELDASSCPDCTPCTRCVEVPGAPMDDVADDVCYGITHSSPRPKSPRELVAQEEGAMFASHA